MRLDHFLPFPARARKNGSAGSRSVFYSAFRRILPAHLFSDAGTRKLGTLRRFLKWLGPTWLSSPLRRVVQSVFFLLFIFLFFYVCWPYRAVPSPVWRGWVPVNVDIAANRIQLERDTALPDLQSRQSLYVSDESDGKDLGSFVLIQMASNTVTLASSTNLSSKAWEDLSFRLGPWSLSPSKPGAWPAHYAEEFADNDRFPVEFFLIIDPLVSLSTAIAAKSWVWSLASAAGILLVCVLIPRGFCGYVCPLGTLIDLFDWAVGKRVKRFRVTGSGWWVHLKYFLLAGVLVAGLMGVLLSGMVAAIPVLTRGLLFTLAPLQDGFARGWHLVPPMNPAQFVSVILFLSVLALGFLQPRFWCKYVCPSGAVFSLGNLFRATERKVEDSCIHCNKCVEICPFDAIKADFTTRITDCTLCQTCGGVCPTHAIKFVERTNQVALKPFNDPPTGERPMGGRLFKMGLKIPAFRRSRGDEAHISAGTAGGESLTSAPTISRQAVSSTPAERADSTWLLSLAQAGVGRRGFMASCVGLAAGIAGGAVAALTTKAFGAHLETNRWRPIRPPGSVPEQDFLELCIRCGECFKVCPNNVLQPVGFQQGLEGLWSPQVSADWAGCEPSCNACGPACPTGAIRALPMPEKRVARMGLAIVNEQTCLPLAGREACQLCVDECSAAGYHAIDFIRVHTTLDERGQPNPGSGFLAPNVLADQCVGCGLCQMRCHSVNAKDKKLLAQSAIIVEAGEGKEDRISTGSYVALRMQRLQGRKPLNGGDSQSHSYLPDFLK